MSKYLKSLVAVTALVFPVLGFAQGKIAVVNLQEAILQTDLAQKRLTEVREGDDYKADKAEFDRLKAELTLAFAGHENAGRPMLLDGGLKWQSMALSPTAIIPAQLVLRALRNESEQIPTLADARDQFEREYLVSGGGQVEYFAAISPEAYLKSGR